MTPTMVVEDETANIPDLVVESDEEGQALSGGGTDKNLNGLTEGISTTQIITDTTSSLSKVIAPTSGTSDVNIAKAPTKKSSGKSTIGVSTSIQKHQSTTNTSHETPKNMSPVLGCPIEFSLLGINIGKQKSKGVQGSSTSSSLTKGGHATKSL
ncbi:hypothetical protein K7X08_035785 [Anisodus acutangulus]|uniref:Uncharacterized protein n=1 Tax=Anisodus acutangulus TaxID=402998 RepID=A0A9Q1LWZ0_9SOLA|nr:hypothetical protein K7X08_035785 [Anisodus acutangulus]